MIAHELVREGPREDPQPLLRLVEEPDRSREQAIASGRIEDALIMKRVGVGLVLGVFATVLVACAIVAIGLLVAGALTVDGVLAGVGGGVLGGVYFGAVIGAGDPARARVAAAAAIASRVTEEPEHRAAA